MPDSYAVEPRTVLGKKVKQLRRQGTLPANVFGRGLESTAVQMNTVEARKMLNAHGRNVLIEITIAGEDAARSVVVRAVKTDPLNDAIQHIDFYQVDLTREIEAEIPAHLVGEAPAVSTWGGILVQESATILIRALPVDMPQFIDVQVDRLMELEQSISVGDVTLPERVTVLSDPTTTIARIARPRIEVEETEEVLEGEEGEELEEGAEPAEPTAEGESSAEQSDS